MEVMLANTGKKFQQRWIFRDIDYQIKEGGHYVISGKNGSGKSTLLMMMAGFIPATSGSISWKCNGKKLSEEYVFRNVSIASPYLELIEEFSFRELIDFQRKFKPFLNRMNTAAIIGYSGLQGNEDKSLKYYSSGMKQRAKLTLAMFADSSLLLLDEPCSNLDEDAVSWYRNMLEKFAVNRTVVVCSNNNNLEYPSDSKMLTLGD